MSTSYLFSRRLAVLWLVAGVGLSGCAGLASAPSASVQQQIQSARTPADHEALAAYYVKQATAARANAEDHRKMGKAYRMAPPGGRGGGSMPAHCSNTAAGYEEMASRFDAMASEHRHMAAQAKP